MNRQLRTFGIFILFGLLSLGVSGASAGLRSQIDSPLAPEEMDYRDFSETEAALGSMAEYSQYVRLETIGESIDYRTHPASPDSYPIYAVRISGDSPAWISDPPNKNAILFDCGAHAREWLTSESCLALAHYLVLNRTDVSTGVPELLDYADVWIIPMVNPSGRVLDDSHGGDPTQFFNVSPWPTGWRNNADTRLCNMGVNVARNFSRGFNDSEAMVYCSSPYRGFAPFSTSEANALRQFVNNHMISFAVTSHSEGQLIWNQWGTADVAATRMIDKAAETWRLGGWTTAADRALYDLARSGVGGGNGQFSAWLANTSDRSENEIDQSVSPWGNPGDLPIAGDFDGDGQADDVAFYHTAAGGTDQYYWYYDYDHDGSTEEVHGPWPAHPGGRPFAGDFDSDGEFDDVAVFNTSELTWYFDYNHDGISTLSYDCSTPCQHPVALDADGDGFADDRASFCTADQRWYFDYNHDCSTDVIGPVWGLVGDLPFSGDFDRDGDLDDLGVYRPSTRIWYYDLDHNGTTDHASGPWGNSSGLPVGGNFNYDPTDTEPDLLMDDVGLFTPASHLWEYDEYHNATFPQLDDGTRRGIQTIMLELPVKDDNYPSSMYIQAPGDGSNGFHPSGDAVDDMIDDAFVPMGLYLIRQARAPGCPTNSSGSAESAYCPADDAGLVGAKIVAAAASDSAPGALRSVPAARTGWGSVTPALEQLNWGSYRMIYRVQNFSTSSAAYVVSVTVKRWECPSVGTCSGTVVLTDSRTHTLAARQAVTNHFSISLTQLAFQENSYAYTEGDHYELILEVSPSGGGDDDFTSNDTKIFKFQLVGLQFRLFMPLVAR